MRQDPVKMHPPPQEEFSFSQLYNQSRGVLFSSWDTSGDARIINELSSLPLNDYSKINPRNVDYQLLQTLFNVAKIRNQLSTADEAKS